MDAKDIMAVVESSYMNSESAEYAGVLELALKHMYKLATGEDYSNTLNYEDSGKDYLRINGKDI